MRGVTSADPCAVRRAGASATSASAVAAAAPRLPATKRAASSPRRAACFGSARASANSAPRAPGACRSPQDPESLALAGGLAEVLHVRPGHDGNARRPGLDRALAARRNQASAGERERGAAVDRGELADGVEEVDVGQRVESRGSGVEGGAAQNAQAARLHQPRDLVESLGAAGREDEEGPGREPLPGVEHERLFAFAGRAGHEDRPPRRGARAAGPASAKAGGAPEGRTSGCRTRAPSRPALRASRAAGRPPSTASRRATSLARVCAKKPPRRRYRAKERSEMRPLTSATGMPRARGPLDEERPDLRLGQDDQAGPRGVQGLLDRAARGRTGRRRRRPRRESVRSASSRPAAVETETPKRVPGQPPPKRRQQVPRDSDLADGDRVDPDASREVGPGRQAEAAPHVSEPAASRERAQEGIGGVGG